MNCSGDRGHAVKAERRSFQRVRVKIYGRFMLEDRSEHPCQVIDMSPGNVALRTERKGQPAKRSSPISIISGASKA
jgi:hypothetical protein